MKYSSNYPRLMRRTLLLSGAFLMAVPGSTLLAASAAADPAAMVEMRVDQQREYQGVVIDANTSDVIIGASIRLKSNPDKGTITDIEGRFRFTASPGDVLEITYIGYKTKR